MELVYFFVCFAACTIGAICGVGGGVVIKPVLDLISDAGASAISFLSGCTVLAMCLYSVIKGAVSKENSVTTRESTPLAVGAAAGGIIGKELFSALVSAAADKGRVSGIQALVLLIVTVGTLIYTIRSEKIKTLEVKNIAARACIGLALGLLSSFLGIGGGPINLVVLYYFFSMDVKTAASNSLYIILFSQAASLITTVVTGKIPVFSWSMLILMILGGLFGGIAGRAVCRKIDSSTVKKLFIALMALIIVICIYNSRSILFSV